LNKAVFLDRDGTIAEDVHYCSSVKDFRLFDEVPKAIRMLNENGFKVIVITNQSGIARRIFTEETLECIHKRMEEALACFGAYIDWIDYCPHHPDDKCRCRKPKTALFQFAIKKFDIDVMRSFMVGDMQMDIDAGLWIGCRTVSVSLLVNDADYYAENVGDAVNWILTQQ